jgi:hypothetical protein
MSQLKVNALVSYSGNTVTLGTSGDTINVASGVTFNTGSATVNYPAGSITDAAISSTAAIQQSKISGNPTFRNIVINGDMSLAQRSTSVASLTTGGYRTLDRWYFDINSIGTWTMSQSTDTPTGQGFANSLKVDCTTADASPAAGDYLQLIQIFEGQNLQYLKKGTANAVSLTASFWVKSTKTGTFIAEFFDNDNSRSISKSYTVNVSDTWEKKTITIPGDTTGAFGNDNGASFYLIIWLAAGTNFTSGTLATTWGSRVNANTAVGQVNIADSTSNDFLITGVQLEAGTSASDFEFLPIDVNLGRCQRYYYKAITGTLFNQIAFCNVRTTTSHYAFLQMPVTLRANPSSVDFSGLGIIASWGAGVTALTGLTFANAAYGAGTTQVLLDATLGSGVGTVGNISFLIGNNSVSNFVALNAEL